MSSNKSDSICDNKQQEYLSWKRLLLSKAKLKASSSTSGLMSGFAMVAMVEINLQDKLPSALCIVFSAMTTILISVHVFALMISVCILPNIETVSNLHNSSYIQQELQIKTSPNDSPHIALRKYIEIAWIFSTGLGTLLFLMEIPVLMWVKFYSLNKNAAIVSTAIMLPVCIVFVIFSMAFYRKLVGHKHNQSTKEMEELQLIVTKLNNDEEVGGSSPKIDKI